MLQKLVENSQNAINDGIYAVTDTLPKSDIDLQESIRNNNHASLITEIKFSSPAEGDIRQISDPLQIAKSMISGGAQALSILTQPYLFNGSPEYFVKIRKNVKIPLLMKDVMIDKIQIDAAKKMGADYFLLIQALFDNDYVTDLDRLIDYGHKKGLKILLEAHTKTEFVNALKTNADIIGINNRNLDTLEINLETTKQLLEDFQKSKIILSESGIKSVEDVKFLHGCGADAFLIGTSIMKSPDIQTSVSKLVNAI
ncbi:Indole-3-glycerol phosphate synthase protein [Marine Group I thaumarchaeote SCGC AAA799-O18]|nr:Indole-3-glycerol phosphate synthase protein [Marine Group I thaumarchaeote SCGC AAA799-O18]